MRLGFLSRPRWSAMIFVPRKSPFHSLMPSASARFSASSEKTVFVTKMPSEIP